MFISPKKFKRLRRIQDEESDGEAENDPEQDREHIAMDLFSDDVSIKRENLPLRVTNVQILIEKKI